MIQARVGAWHSKSFGEALYPQEGMILGKLDMRKLIRGRKGSRTQDGGLGIAFSQTGASCVEADRCQWSSMAQAV